MEAVELSILNDLKTSLNITDDDAIRVVEIFGKLQENRLNSSMGEIKSFLKEEFHSLELKMEKNKSDIDLQMRQNKSDIDLKFEQVNTKFEQFDRKLDKTGFDLELKIEKSGNNSVRWFMGLSVAVMLMILGLYATVIFRFYV